MRRLLLLAAVTAGGVVGSAGAARAEGQRPHWPIPAPDIHECTGPHSTSVTWPSVVPPGWYTDTYRHRWYFPWYAYYNYSMGPYANWMVGGGYAGYASHGPAGIYYSHKPPAEPYGEWAGRMQGLGGFPSAAPATPPEAVPPKKDEKKDEKPKAKDGDKGGKVTVTLPTDARLLFNGVAANGTGGTRTFQTPPLHPGQSYQYELTAEVLRNGRVERATGTVIVRAGETASAILVPVPVPGAVAAR